MKDAICHTCGQLQGIKEYDERLWDIYSRIDDGRSHREALVYDSEWLQENVIDDEDYEAVTYAMEKDMHSRGLCTECGRPDLSNVNPDDILSEEDARDLADMYAEQAAERRAGC
jgi:hypothetical protein